jgi:hypothetical protein
MSATVFDQLDRTTTFRFDLDFKSNHNTDMRSLPLIFLLTLVGCSDKSAPSFDSNA